MFKWLHRVLGIPSLNDVQTIQTELDLVKTELNNASIELDTLRISTDRLFNSNHSLSKRILHSVHQYNELMKLVDIGVNVENTPTRYKPGPTNWAVVCLGGKVQQLRFCILDERNPREMLEFLNYYDKANRIVDAGPFIHEMLRNNKIEY
jgi:hypothetical protein